MHSPRRHCALGWGAVRPQECHLPPWGARWPESPLPFLSFLCRLRSPIVPSSCRCIWSPCPAHPDGAPPPPPPHQPVPGPSGVTHVPGVLGDVSSQVAPRACGLGRYGSGILDLLPVEVTWQQKAPCTSKAPGPLLARPPRPVPRGLPAPLLCGCRTAVSGRPCQDLKWDLDCVFWWLSQSAPVGSPPISRSPNALRLPAWGWAPSL